MNNAQAFVIALCLCVIGAGLIYLGTYTVATYSQFFRRDPQRTIVWDALTTILIGPWSAPVVLAGLTIALGSIALSIGASIAGFILWFEFSQRLS